MNRVLSLPRVIWRNRRRQSTLPRFLTYLVTFSCNARCIMCDAWRKPVADRELSADELDMIFAQLPRLDVVRLSGGEPFLRKDLSDIASLVQERLRPFVLHITTNGLLTERIVRFCETRPKRQPLHMLISVDGAKAKHNQVRGLSTAWDRVMTTLRALAPYQRQFGLRLATNQTIVDAEGAEQYRQVAELAQSLGILHHAVMAYDASATYHQDAHIALAPSEIGQFSTFGQFTPHQIHALLQTITRDVRQYPFFTRLAKRYYLNGLAARLLHRRSTPNPPCVALRSHLRLLPDGTVPTCQFNTHPVGNLREQSFVDVWASPHLQQQRRWVDRCSGCWAECEVVPNAIYSGDLLLKALPLAFSSP